MNITVAPWLLLPTLGIIYQRLLDLTQSSFEENIWKSILVMSVNNSCPQLTDELLQGLANHGIPVTVIDHLQREYHPKSGEVIVSDELLLDAVKSNRSTPRVYLMHAKGELQRQKDAIGGKVLFLVWGTGEMYCKNTLLSSGWVRASDPDCLSDTVKNLNNRSVTVFVRPEMHSYVDIHGETGENVLTGFKGMILYELERFLGVDFQYTIPRGLERVHTPFRRWQTFIPALRGVVLGKINETLIESSDDDQVVSELYFWGRPYKHSKNYTSFTLGRLNTLLGYYGSHPTHIHVQEILVVNYNYALLLTLVLLATFLILLKVALCPRRPSVYDLAFDFISQCFGQRRNCYYYRTTGMILLATTSFLAYFTWSLNCATLVSLLAVDTDRFKDYAALNASGWPILMTNSTQQLYCHIEDLATFRNLRTVDSQELRATLYKNSSRKAFLVESPAVPQTNTPGAISFQRLYKFKDPYASRMTAFAISRNSPMIVTLRLFFNRMIESGIIDQFQRWADWFVRHRKGVDGNSRLQFSGITYTSFKVVVDMYLKALLVYVLVFIGEIIHFRAMREWRWRRN